MDVVLCYVIYSTWPTPLFYVVSFEFVLNFIFKLCLFLILQDELWNSIEEFNYDEDAVGRCHQACIDIVNEYNAFTSSESVPAGCTALAYVATRGSFDTHCQGKVDLSHILVTFISCVSLYQYIFLWCITCLYV